MQLSQKQMSFSQFFFFLTFWKSTLYFEHYQKKMPLTGDVFLQLRTPENVPR